MLHPLPVLHQTLQASILGLLKNYGFDAPSRRESPPGPYIAVMGFSGPKLWGSLGLIASEDFLLHSHELVLCSPGSAEEHQDWLGELANQIMGQCKNHLFAYGLSIALSSPLVLRGLQITIHTPPSSPLIYQKHLTTLGTLQVWLDVRHPPDLALQRIEVVNDSPAAVGELLLF